MNKVWVCDDGKYSRLEEGEIVSVLDNSNVLEVESCIWGYGECGVGQLPMKRFFYLDTRSGEYYGYVLYYKDIDGKVVELPCPEYQLLLFKKPE